MNTTQPLTLQCELRTTKGKQNRTLRKTHKVPGVIFGEGQDSVSVTLDYKTILDVYRKAGETTVVECVLEGKAVPTLISEVSIDPVRETIQHVDFRRVNLKKKVTADVPVEIMGEPSIVKQGQGVVLQQMQKISVEAFPQNIPHSIVVDISDVTEVGTEIKISDIAASPDYVIVDEADRVVVSIVAHKEESVEVQSERTETEITTEKAPEEGEVTEGTPTAEPATEAPQDKSGK